MNKAQLFLSRLVRHCCTALPDAAYLRLLYFAERSRLLNLRNPMLFQEKIQWLKLHNRDKRFTTMVDKIAVKDYVARAIGQKYVIPTIGIWNSFDEIDFNSLPEKFVLKTSHGGGSMGVVVCSERSKLDLAHAKRMLEASLRADIYRTYREWPYRDVPRRILAEEFIEMPGKDELSDYKIFCFNGVPKYIQLIQDRHSGETIDFYDTDWHRLPFIGLNPKAHHAAEDAPRPEGLDEMLQIAAKLSSGIPFLRVDLYNIAGRILFGELTFFPASGLGRFAPSEWDRKLGDLIELKKNN